MPEVSTCMCEECHYNDHHNCKADSIEVKSMGDNKVLSYEGTCCKTFKNKDDSNKMY